VTRKLAEAEEHATALWGMQPHRVAGCWIVRDSRRNRQLLQRYPEVFPSRFEGSSRGWVEALTICAAAAKPVEPPREPGLVWCDASATRLFAWRRR
jgi:hypothetical protein